MSSRRLRSRTSSATQRCTRGATLRYKRDLVREQGTSRPTWKCRDYGTQVPGRVAERIRHQHSF